MSDIKSLVQVQRTTDPMKESEEKRVTKRFQWVIASGAAGVLATSLMVTAWSGTASANELTAHTGRTASTVVKNAESAIKKYLGKPKFVAPGPKVDAAKVKGKKILIVAHDQVADQLVGIKEGAELAAAAAGLNASFVNGNAKPSTIVEGIQQGINQKVGAILLDGVSATLIPDSLEKAQAAHIPVVGMGIPSKSEHVDVKGLNAEAIGNLTVMGELAADEAIVQEKGKVRAVVETFDNPDSVVVERAMKKTLSKCSDCKVVASTNITPTGWPTQVAPDTEAMVKAHPTANFVLPTADTMGIFATSGIAQAKATTKVKVASADASGAGPLGLVKTGKVFIADPGASDYWIGWEGVDQALRLMTGMKPGNPIVPVRFLDSSNLKDANISSFTALFGSIYKSGYKKLWGLS